MRKTLLLLTLIVALLFCMPSILARGASLPTSVMTEKDAMPCESSATTRAVDIPHSITLDRSSADLVMAENWTVRFIEALMQGRSIAQAINDIAEDSRFHTATDQETGLIIPLTAFLPSNVIVCGDENFVLFPNSDP